MRHDRLVLLKDTWRVVWPTLKPEHETYEKLHASGVPDMPQCYGAEDVGGEDTDHRTQTRKWADRLHKMLTLRGFRHYRITLAHMDRTLHNFTDVREMVAAVRDASVAHRVAVASAQILHRDISVGNIMITFKDEEVKGYLIDWDLCLDLTQQGEAQSERTGTWQFTAIRLLRKPQKGDSETLVAGRVDDVESFLHVLTWMALRYTAHSLAPEELSSELRDNFDASFTLAGKRYVTDTRASNLIYGFVVNSAGLANEGILKVLRSLTGTLRHRYYVPTLDEELTEAAIKKHELEVQLRLEALKRLDEDDTWLPALLTMYLDDGRIAWEPHHHRVVHKLDDAYGKGR